MGPEKGGDRGIGRALDRWDKGIGGVQEGPKELGVADDKAERRYQGD